MEDVVDAVGRGAEVPSDHAQMAKPRSLEKARDVLPKGGDSRVTIAHHEYIRNWECFHKSCSLTWLSRPQDGGKILSVFSRKILNIYRLQASHLLFCSVLISNLPRSLLPTPGPEECISIPCKDLPTASSAPVLSPISKKDMSLAFPRMLWIKLHE